MTLSSLTSLNALKGKEIGSKNVVMIAEYLTVNQVENCSVATHQIVKIVKKRSTVSQRSNFPPSFDAMWTGYKTNPADHTTRELLLTTLGLNAGVEVGLF